MARLRKGRPKPPEKINVAILRSDHDYLADAIGGTDKPLYEVIHAKLIIESGLVEDLQIVRELLAVAMKDKEALREENNRLNKELEFIHIHTNEVTSDMIKV